MITKSKDVSNDKQNRMKNKIEIWNMKSGIIKVLTIGLMASIGFNSCEEIAPIIDNSTSSDTSFVTGTIPSAQERNVLIEEFTGVGCLNCKDGHDEVKNLETTYGDRLISVSLHAIPVFSDPARISHTVTDLRIDEGTSVANLVGIPIALPSAWVNRKIHDGETEVVVSLNKWAGHIATEMNEVPIVNVNVDILSYDSVNHKIVFETEVTLLEAITDPISLSIVLVEDEVEAEQLNGSTWIEPYDQPHVLRDYLSPYNGKALTSSNVAGQVYVSRYEESIDPSWDVDHLEMVAFVHYNGGDKGFNVLQATAEYIKAH